MQQKELAKRSAFNITSDPASKWEGPLIMLISTAQNADN